MLLTEAQGSKLKAQSNLNPMSRDADCFRDYDSSSQTEPILFFYTWDHAAITTGRIQNQRQQLMNEAEALGIACYIRPTGGRAVLHGGDICYTFIARQSDEEFGGTLCESFKKVNNYVIDLTANLLNLNLIPRHCETRSVEAIPLSNLQKFNCFNSSINNEGSIEISGVQHKIIGAAQSMGSRAFIQQGSIQLNKVDIDLPYFHNNKTLSELVNRDFDLEKICLELNHLIS